MFKHFLLMSVFALVFLLMGCSGSSPMLPGSTDQAGITSSDSDYQIWMSGTMILNNDGETGSLVERTSELNYNITGLLGSGCPGGCFHFRIVGIVGTVLEVELTIENPASLQPYDVRLVYENLYGKTVMNPDSYTDMFYPAMTVMPFTAFATDDPNRAFPIGPGGVDTQTLFLDYPGGSSPSIDYMIVAHLPGNTREPYEINGMQQDGILTPAGGHAELSCYVLDHQDDVRYVAVDTSPLTGSYVLLTADASDPGRYFKHISNLVNAPAGIYTLLIMATSPNPQKVATYNYIDVEVTEQVGWSDPIPVAIDTSLSEILPRLVLRDSDYMVIYSDGTDALSKSSADFGYTWDSPLTIGTYAEIDTMHAVKGGDGNVYVQYQRSPDKNLYNSKFDGTSWAEPVNTTYHAMTVAPYSCDLGVDSSGYLYTMLAGDWSTFGFRSVNPYDISTWADDGIESFYNGVYSMNDGFVQWADVPKFFFVHEGNQLDYAWYESGWSKAALRVEESTTLIEPAIAPESDGPYHGVITVFDGTDYAIQYFRYDTLPPTAEHTVMLETGLIDRMHSSISVNGNLVAILYDADDEVRYVESTDGGNTFGPATVLSAGYYSHVRIDPLKGKVIAAYAVEESGNMNIYVRIKN